MFDFIYNKLKVVFNELSNPLLGYFSRIKNINQEAKKSPIIQLYHYDTMDDELLHIHHQLFTIKHITEYALINYQGIFQIYGRDLGDLHSILGCTRVWKSTRMDIVRVNPRLIEFNKTMRLGIQYDGLPSSVDLSLMSDNYYYKLESLLTGDYLKEILNRGYFFFYENNNFYNQGFKIKYKDLEIKAFQDFFYRQPLIPTKNSDPEVLVFLNSRVPTDSTYRLLDTNTVITDLNIYGKFYLDLYPYRYSYFNKFNWLQKGISGDLLFNKTFKLSSLFKINYKYNEYLWKPLHGVSAREGWEGRPFDLKYYYLQFRSKFCGMQFRKFVLEDNDTLSAIQNHTFFYSRQGFAINSILIGYTFDQFFIDFLRIFNAILSYKLYDYFLLFMIFFSFTILVERLVWDSEDSVMLKLRQVATKLNIDHQEVEEYEVPLKLYEGCLRWIGFILFLYWWNYTKSYDLFYKKYYQNLYRDLDLENKEKITFLSTIYDIDSYLYQTDFIIKKEAFYQLLNSYYIHFYKLRPAAINILSGFSRDTGEDKVVTAIFSQILLHDINYHYYDDKITFEEVSLSHYFGNFYRAYLKYKFLFPNEDYINTLTSMDHEEASDLWDNFTYFPFYTAPDLWNEQPYNLFQQEDTYFNLYDIKSPKSLRNFNHVNKDYKYLLDAYDVPYSEYMSDEDVMKYMPLNMHQTLEDRKYLLHTGSYHMSVFELGVRQKFKYKELNNLGTYNSYFVSPEVKQDYEMFGRSKLILSIQADEQVKKQLTSSKNWETLLYDNIDHIAFHLRFFQGMDSETACFRSGQGLYGLQKLTIPYIVSNIFLYSPNIILDTSERYNDFIHALIETYKQMCYLQDTKFWDPTFTTIRPIYISRKGFSLKTDNIFFETSFFQTVTQFSWMVTSYLYIDLFYLYIFF